jgi:hypothetical protein
MSSSHFRSIPMSTKRIKEPHNLQLANEIGRLRYREGLSRNNLVAELHKIIHPECLLYNKVNYELIKNLETYKRVNISCELVEALCKALHCTRQERANLFLYAGRSVLVGDSNAPDDVAKVLHNVIGLANEDVRELLVIRLDNRHAEELDEKEQCKLVIEALRLLERHLERS